MGDRARDRDVPGDDLGPDVFDRGHERAERAGIVEAGGTFISLSAKVCPYDPCPLVVGATLLWRDETHLTARFSRQLAPSIGRLLAQSIAAASTASGGPGAWWLGGGLPWSIVPAAALEAARP